MFRGWILVVSVVNRLVVILFSVRNVTGGFVVVVLMCLGWWVYSRVEMSFSVEHTLDHNCSVEEKLEFKRGEDAL